MRDYPEPAHESPPGPAEYFALAVLAFVAVSATLGDSLLRGFASLEKNMVWLATVLAARDFPLEHLARNLELCADVIGDERVAATLRAAATVVRGV